MNGRKDLTLGVLALCVGAGLIVGFSTLPSLASRSASMALTDTDATRLGRAIAPRVTAHSGQSGLYPLADSHAAFAARVLLAQAAERSLDGQSLWPKTPPRLRSRPPNRRAIAIALLPLLAPAKSAALVQHLGSFPFWRGEVSPLEGTDIIQAIRPYKHPRFPYF